MCAPTSRGSIVSSVLSADPFFGILPQPRTLTERLMSKLSVAAIDLLLLPLVMAGVSAGAAQSASSASKDARVATVLPLDTTVCTVLDESVNSRKAKVGDAISARVVLAAVAQGKVLVPEGSKVTGHVTQANARSRDNRESRVGIVFDRVLLKRGGWFAVNLIVQAVGPREVPGKQEQVFSVENTPTGGTVMVPSHETSGGTPTLDQTAEGAVGLRGLTLLPGTNAAGGSVIASSSKDVTLYSGSQLVLRVIAAKPGN